MAKFRYAVLVNDKALTTTVTSGTETIDLPERGILQQLQILYRHTGAYVDNTILPPVYAIKKVEVLVDGSTVVKSLTGAQIRALMWYNGGPYTQTNDYTQSQIAKYLYHDFHLYFGRSVDDTKMGLDLGAFSNPQLKIEFDEATTTHDGVTYDVYATPAVEYNVAAKIMDGTPAGFQNKYVQSRQIDSFTGGASIEHGTEIPRGYPLRGLMLRGAYKNIGYYEFWDHLKLDFDNGKWLPIDMDYENLVRLQLNAWPNPVKVSKYTALADGNDLNTGVYYVSGSGWSGSAANIFYVKIPIIYWPISTVSIKDNTGAAPAGQGAFTFNCTGWGPMQTFYIPMSKLMTDGIETVDTTAYGRIDLKATTGTGSTSSHTSTIVAEYDKPNASE